MKQFEAPEIKIEKFVVEDVLTTSAHWGGGEVGI